MRQTNRTCLEVLMNGFSEIELVSSGQLFVPVDPEANSTLKKTLKNTPDVVFLHSFHACLLRHATCEFQFLSRITKQT